MKLEQQVVSLELAKELKEAGYPQEGIWSWSDNKDRVWLVPTKIADKHWMEYTVAPTVAELGEALPDIQMAKFGEGDKRWACGYNNGTSKDKRFCDWLMCNVMAKMWLYLKRENLI